MKKWRFYSFLIYFIVLVLILVLYDYFSYTFLNRINNSVNSWIDTIVKSLITGLSIMLMYWYRNRGKKDKN
jgi:hypothetical protein